MSAYVYGIRSRGFRETDGAAGQIFVSWGIKLQSVVSPLWQRHGPSYVRNRRKSAEQVGVKTA